MNNKLFKNYIPELTALSFGRKAPNTVSINITSNCNQKCIYCEIGNDMLSSSPERLYPDYLKWLIEQMAHANIPRLAINGGEPFLFDGILEVIELAGKNKIRCSITSNGMTVFQLENRELEIIRKYKVRINISIDSFDPDLNNYIRGNKNALSNALKSIERLNKYHIDLIVLCVISKHNYKTLSNFIKTAHAKGIKEVLFQPVIHFSNFPDREAVRDKARLNVSPDEIPVLMAELNKILRYENRHAIKTNTYRIKLWIEKYIKTASKQDGSYFFRDILHKFYCRDLFSTIEIGYDGGIQACPLAQASNTIQSSKEIGIVKAWEIATEELKKDLNNGIIHPMCNACCHHFSRNMIASLIKYPLHNFNALLLMIPVLFERIFYSTVKKLKRI